MARPPFMECPRYEWCSANVCPLDPAAHEKLRLPGEPVCGLAKSIRVRIGARYPDLLPLGGLTSREAAGKRAWERKTPEQRAALKPQTPEFLARARAIKAERRRAAVSSVAGSPQDQAPAEVIRVHPDQGEQNSTGNGREIVSDGANLRRAAS